MAEKKEELNIVSGVDIPDWYIVLEPKLIEKMERLSELEKEVKDLKNSIILCMKDEGIDKITSGMLSVSLVTNSKSNSFDRVGLEEKFPEIWDQYVKQFIKERQKAPYLLIKNADVSKA